MSHGRSGPICPVVAVVREATAQAAPSEPSEPGLRPGTRTSDSGAEWNSQRSRHQIHSSRQPAQVMTGQRSRVLTPQRRHLRGTISSNELGILARELLAAELADFGLEDDDPLLERADSRREHVKLEVLFVDAVVDGEDVTV
jgi:hypothetical protein